MFCLLGIKGGTPQPAWCFFKIDFDPTDGSKEHLWPQQCSKCGFWLFLVKSVYVSHQHLSLLVCEEPCKHHNTADTMRFTKSPGHPQKFPITSNLVDHELREPWWSHVKHRTRVLGWFGYVWGLSPKYSILLNFDSIVLVSNKNEFKYFKALRCQMELKWFSNFDPADVPQRSWPKAVGIVECCVSCWDWRGVQRPSDCFS